MLKDFNWTEFLDKCKGYILNGLILAAGVAAIILIARFFLKQLTRFTTKGMEDARKMEDRQRGKDIMTYMTVTRSIGRYVIYIIAVVAIGYWMGWGSAFSNILAAAGIGTLAISFGAQSIVQDVVTGFFLMFEKQYGVGDYVQINDYMGTVTAMAMRCTYLKTWKGETIVIPNGQIKTVTNYSGEFNMAIVEVPTSYDDDTRAVAALIMKTATTYYEAHPDICFDKPTVKVISSYGDSSVNITVQMKAVGRNHYTIQNDLRLLIKEAMEANGFSIPFNQLVIHQADDNPNR